MISSISWAHLIANISKRNSHFISIACRFENLFEASTTGVAYNSINWRQKRLSKVVYSNNTSVDRRKCIDWINKFDFGTKKASTTFFLCVCFFKREDFLFFRTFITIKEPFSLCAHYINHFGAEINLLGCYFEARTTVYTNKLDGSEIKYRNWLEELRNGFTVSINKPEAIWKRVWISFWVTYKKKKKYKN